MNSTRSCSPRPLVLIITCRVGAGHVQAGRAVHAALRTGAADIETRCVDSLDFASRAFRAFYAGGYSLAVTRLPRLYGLGYWLTDRPRRPGRSIAEHVRLGFERRAMRRLTTFVRELRPDLIVNTHFLAPHVIGHMIDRRRIDTRQFVVVTDNEVHRWWYAENVARYFAPAPFSAEALRRFGIPDERITVSGMPVHPKWTRPLEKRKVLADWSLPADRPIVLLSGGTEFVCGPIIRLAKGILSACPSVQLVVLAGRNKKLLARLARLTEAGGRLTPLGFTDRLHELSEVAALMVTKAGGLTTAECLARGTPMLLLRPVPGQERGNAEYFVREGAAVIVRRPGRVAEEVRRLLDSPEELARMADNCRRLHRPATDTIVEAIRRAVSPSAPVVSPAFRSSGR